MNRTFQQVYHFQGTMAANATPIFKAHTNMTLLHVSFVATNAANSTLIIGTTSDDDAFMKSTAVGQSSVPAEVGRSGFVGSQYPRISDGDVVKLTLDYDGAAGTAGANVTIVLTFAEG